MFTHNIQYKTGPKSLHIKLGVDRPIGSSWELKAVSVLLRRAMYSLRYSTSFYRKYSSIHIQIIFRFFIFKNTVRFSGSVFYLKTTHHQIQITFHLSRYKCLMITIGLRHRRPTKSTHLVPIPFWSNDTMNTCTMENSLLSVIMPIHSSSTSIVTTTAAATGAY